MNVGLDGLKKLLDLDQRITRDEVKLADEQDWARCRPVLLPDGTLSGVKAHAKIGVRALLANPYFFIADEMGGMKTAQAIIAAQFLYLQGTIDRVIVVAPTSVRDVWFDKDLGELSLHLFKEGVPARVSEFHAKIRQWDWGDWTDSKNQLRWIITNYEFIRSKERIKQLKAYCGPRTLLVLDESSAVKSKTAIQSKACLELRRACGRVVALNGTPIADTPMDLLNQCNILSPQILECPYITMFRDRYCVMNPASEFPQIMGWKNLEDLQRRLAPYVLRRLKEHCLDLPPKLPPQNIYVALKADPTWKAYKSMRDDMVAWISSTHASLAGQAITKVMRLAQITSGFVSGVEEVVPEAVELDVPEFMRTEDWFLDDVHAEESETRMPVAPRPSISTEAFSREKLDAVLEFFGEHLAHDPAFKLVVWCRFRAELDRLVEEVRARWPHVRTAALVGGQKKLDRQLALRLLHPRTAAMNEPALLAGTTGTGSMGHNFTAAHTVLRMSYDYSLFKYQQSSDRNHRPGQTKPVSYFDLVATGPAGQQTIDHMILKARNSKADVAKWTSDAWIDELRAE